MKYLQADSMGTKHEFPTERMDKLMENDKAVSHKLIHTNSHFAPITPQKTNSWFKVPAAQ